MGGSVLETLKNLLLSKKFLTYVGGTLACAVLTYVHAPAEIVNWVGGLTGAYLVGQGMADFGKNKPQP